MKIVWKLGRATLEPGRRNHPPRQGPTGFVDDARDELHVSGDDQPAPVDRAVGAVGDGKVVINEQSFIRADEQAAGIDDLGLRWSRAGCA